LTQCDALLSDEESRSRSRHSWQRNIQSRTTIDGTHHLAGTSRFNSSAQLRITTICEAPASLVRSHATQKRGAEAIHVPLDSGIAAGGPLSVDLIALDEALAGLAALDVRKVQVVELKFFADLTVEETAEVLNVSPDTVARGWRMARAWLPRELSTARGVESR
jgi:hypothetical protein